VNAEIFAQARQYAADRMQRELPPHLTYHGLAHTRDEVVPAVELFANLEGILGEPLYLLLTAAWFHDLGYVEQTANHESIGAQIAAQVLPSLGYTENQIETIRSAIMATVLPQSPGNVLEQILADADLDVLGRENFMRRNQDLRQELAFLGKEFTDEEWYSGQLRFLEGHNYFTAAARSLRNTQKQLSVATLRNLLETLKMKK
jgi:uncharacterized protein